MNFCEKYSDLIHDLLEDELDEQLSAKAETHIFACHNCREQYEMLRDAKEIYNQYLFDAEPPPDSWTDFQTRLISENEQIKDEKVITVNWFRRRKTVLGFNLSPAAAALAAALIVCGIGFALLQTRSVKKDGDRFIAEKESENSPTPTQSQETDQTPKTELQSQTITNGDALKNTDLLAENKSLKAQSNSLPGKRAFAKMVKINQKPASLNARRKSANETRLSEANRLSDLQAENLETEITGQMEKVELLLRSFRNARANETVEGFDVEYEKRQARKLIDKIALLKREAENFGLSYAGELLSLVEPHLLEIANLETNPSTDRVLDIKTRVSSQNIIASLQGYSRDATQ